MRIYSFNFIKILPLIIVLLSSCSDFKSDNELENDINVVKDQIEEATVSASKYPGGVLGVLANVRLETLKSTKAMLEQKKIGLKRFLTFSYSIDGKEYTPPKNKNELLDSVNNDIKLLESDLIKSQNDSEKKGSGLLGILAMTEMYTVKNSIALTKQRQLLLKHDIPYYSYIPARSNKVDSEFKPTPGKDLDKL